MNTKRVECSIFFKRNNTILPEYAGRIYFTLLELLVVISIIMILVSILMPALRTAKESARQIVCSGNQKQVGVAFVNYSTDFNSFFPWAWTNSSDADNRSYAHLLHNAGYFSSPLPEYKGSGWATSDEIKKAQATVSFLKCPSDPATNYNQPVNYCMNSMLQNDYGVWVAGSSGIWGLVYPRITKIKTPLSEKSLLLCSKLTGLSPTNEPVVAGYYHSNHDLNLDGFINKLDGWRNLHSGYINGLYCDGHVGKKKEFKVSKEIGN